MSTRIVIAGTDTGIGKTVFAAALTGAIDGCYWKPIQAGIEDETDSMTVRRLTGFEPGRILPEAYKLTLPASPHIAAAHDGVEIETGALFPPPVARPLVIELAGGLLVPLSNDLLQIDVVRLWRAPVVLVSSTRLGTINHTLLSIEALKRRAIPILGVAFMGDESADAQRAICMMGGVRMLGRLGPIATLDATTLAAAFQSAFDVADILGLNAIGP